MVSVLLSTHLCAASPGSSRRIRAGVLKSSSHFSFSNSRRRDAGLRVPRSPILRVATTPADVGEAEEVPSPSSPSDSEAFSWRDHWYPVSLVEDLDPAVPTPFQLLNRDIVIWKDPATSQWVALDDRCPHRLAPLSVSTLHRFSVEFLEFQELGLCGH